MHLPLPIVYSLGTLATVATAAWTLRRATRSGLGSLVPAACVAITFSSSLLILQFLKLQANRDYVDFAASMEILHNISTGRGAWCSIQEGFVPGAGNWLSTHFTPLIYVAAFFHKLLPRPETALVLQFLALSTTLWITYAYARSVLRSREAALLLAGSTALYPTFQYIHLYAWEMLRFCIPALLGVFWSIERRSARGYWAFLALSLLMREEVALTTLLIGVYVFTLKDWRRHGAATIVVSACYFLAVTQWVMPSFRHGAEADRHVAAYWFSALGTSMGGVLWGILTKPLVVLGLALNPYKLASLFLLLLPLAFVPLAAFPLQLIALANAGLNSLSGSLAHTSYFLYYLSPTVAVVFASLIHGAERIALELSRRLPLEAGKSRLAVAQTVFLTAACASIMFGPSPASLTFWLRSWKLAPFRTQSFHRSEYAATARDRSLPGLLEAVPAGAGVTAEQHILPRLFDRGPLWVFPQIGDARFAVFDKRRESKSGVSTVPGSWDGFRERPQEYYDLIEKDAAWSLVKESDGFFIYRRISP